MIMRLTADEVLAVVGPLVDAIEWTDLRRGVMHIRLGDDIYLIDVHGINEPRYLELMVRQAPTYARNLRYVPGCRYYDDKGNRIK